MVQTPKIFGQNKPPANVDTNLFTVANTNQAQISIFVCNQADDYERFTISLVPANQSEQPENYLAFNTLLSRNAVLAFSGIYLNNGDKVQVSSVGGNCSFTATGIDFSP